MHCLAALRRFRIPTGGKASKLDGYQKKKYVSKLLFIFLLGHDLEFGHLEAVNLLAAQKFSEKQIGYLFVSVVISDSHDMANMISEAVASDLRSTKELHVCLALNCIANMGGKVMAAKVRLLVRVGVRA
jgi:AP-2 complex subunit alpha